MVARSLGLDRTDALAILREIGADTAGALSFGAPSDRRAWAFTPLRELYDAPDDATALGRHIDDLGRRPLLVGEDGVRQSLAGGQKKSALAVAAPNGDPVLRLPEAGDVLTVPRFGAPSTIIVKPDNPALPGIVENEAYCLHLARAVGIGAVAVTTLAAGERSVLCVLRYDRRIARTGCCTGSTKRISRRPTVCRPDGNTRSAPSRASPSPDSWTPDGGTCRLPTRSRSSIR